MFNLFFLKFPPYQNPSPQILHKSINNQQANTANLSPSQNTNSSPIISTPRQGHQFKVKTFDKPKNCEHCTSVMIGFRRQGTICDKCQFTCHVHCARNAMNICPIPEEARRMNKGFKIKEGVGTAYDGVVKVPKPAGVKKGWQRMKMTLCDFKLYLFEMQEKTDQVSCAISQALDMRDQFFTITECSHEDVIHAQKRHVPLIFRISVSSVVASSSNAQQSNSLPNNNNSSSQQQQFFDNSSSSFQSFSQNSNSCNTNQNNTNNSNNNSSNLLKRSSYNQLILVDNPTEKRKWMNTINELNTKLRLPDHPKNPDDLPLPLNLFEAYDSSLQFLQQEKLHCAMVCSENSDISSEKVILGTEEGMYCLDTNKDEIVQIDAKRQIHAIIC